MSSFTIWLASLLQDKLWMLAVRHVVQYSFRSFTTTLEPASLGPICSKWWVQIQSKHYLTFDTEAHKDCLQGPRPRSLVRRLKCSSGSTLNTSFFLRDSDPGMSSMAYDAVKASNVGLASQRLLNQNYTVIPPSRIYFIINFITISFDIAISSATTSLGQDKALEGLEGLMTQTVITHCRLGQS